MQNTMLGVGDKWPLGKKNEDLGKKKKRGKEKRWKST